ncbi:copper resistance protein CopC [Galbitalea sp. SE-J8]|uniref:copper resistance CopC family protein n=1 Tax=Galbitalea sp. SE-J8 TaxID=3054952 RepID=UPI00259CD4BB|nr:copper resistance CopC family protein [Galbitalea sp. SE-J8]MDM4764097.1 copper resistance protein CopC [Galbitalea sp. SE-J8]
MTLRTRTRVGASAAAGLALAVAAVLAVAAPASAHNYVVSSTPVAGSTLDTLPAEFAVTTNGPLPDASGEGRGFGLLLTDAAGRYYGDGCVTIDGDGISAPAAIGAAGDYTLTWQVVSTDGHIASGTIPFRWTGAATSDGSSAVPDCGGKHPLTSVVPPSAGARGSAPETVDVSSLLWIGGAVLAVLVAVGITLVLVRPRRRAADDDSPAG